MVKVLIYTTKKVSKAKGKMLLYHEEKIIENKSTTLIVSSMALEFITSKRVVSFFTPHSIFLLFHSEKETLVK